MKKLILLIILLFSIPSFASLKADKIKDLIKKTDPSINIGIKIKNLDTNTIVYQQNTDRYFTFASGLKFITLVTLLEELGGDYKFDSSILKRNKDYYLDIHDPEFSTQDLETLVLSLKNQNINNIKGNFYITNKEFLLPPLIRTKTVGDTVYCNSSLITGRLHEI
ncbi:MAG: D-alanyl-D-alanine carboxypeptidase [Rickettsiaceae bacterium]